MRFFELLSFQHVMLAFLPTLVLIIVFALFLGYSRLRRENDEERQQRIIYRYPEDIEDRDAPFPLAMTLVVAGTVLWGFLYILLTGLLGVKI
jgi:hypothetical protein